MGFEEKRGNIVTLETALSNQKKVYTREKKRMMETEEKSATIEKEVNIINLMDQKLNARNELEATKHKRKRKKLLKMIKELEKRCFTTLYKSFNETAPI